jgi:hypothetical protein
MVIKLDEPEVSEAIYEYLCARFKLSYPFAINWIALNENQREIETEILFETEKLADENL